jgi:hypothetical protein
VDSGIMRRDLSDVHFPDAAKIVLVQEGQLAIQNRRRPRQAEETVPSVRMTRATRRVRPSRTSMPDGRSDRATTRLCLRGMRWQAAATDHRGMRAARKADEVMAAQFVQRTQQMILIAQPALVFRDDGRAVAVRAYPERIAPFAAAADVEGTSRNA